MYKRDEQKKEAESTSRENRGRRRRTEIWKGFDYICFALQTAGDYICHGGPIPIRGWHRAATYQMTSFSFYNHPSHTHIHFSNPPPPPFSRSFWSRLSFSLWSAVIISSILPLLDFFFFFVLSLIWFLGVSRLFMKDRAPCPRQVMAADSNFQQQQKKKEIKNINRRFGLKQK